MPDRKFIFFIEDLLESADRIEDYIQDQTKETFSEDQKTVDAVIRNLEIIGEACTHIPEDIREHYPETPWKKVVGSPECDYSPLFPCGCRYDPVCYYQTTA